MQISKRIPAVMLVLSGMAGAPAFAQAPPSFAPGQLEQLVQRVALYPDSLLAQTLAGATYADQIPDAARWADQHHYLTGQALANGITEDHLPWDPSVQALLPFPSVLDMMASDINWTHQIGDAFLAQQPDVMEAVQRDRRKAMEFGYLRSGPEIVVGAGPYITIAPVRPDFIVVPAYDPGIVFFAPRPGFVVGGAIHFGFGVTIGAFFRPWGWGVSRFDWGAHAVFINNAPWRRTWGNRVGYVHPYEGIRRYVARPVEGHALHERSVPEKEAARRGERRDEEHRR